MEKLHVLEKLLQKTDGLSWDLSSHKLMAQPSDCVPVQRLLSQEMLYANLHQETAPQSWDRKVNETSLQA